MAEMSAGATPSVLEKGSTSTEPTVTNGVEAKATSNGTPPIRHTPKNILVTGGAGFIASHVVFLLVDKYPDYNVVNFDRLDYCSCLENLDPIKDRPNYKFVKGNICSADLVTYVLKEEAIDTILHFAAQTHVDNSFGNSFQFTQNNIYGTHVLLESAKKMGIKRFVHVSTDEVYGEGEHDQEPMFEDHVLEPTNPYAATKAGAEFIAKAYYRSFNVPVVITRGNNVYGPHQYPEKLIPKFINQLMRGKKLTIHGTGSTLLRSWRGCRDCASSVKLQAACQADCLFVLPCVHQAQQVKRAHAETGKLKSQCLERLDRFSTQGSSGAERISSLSHKRE